MTALTMPLDDITAGDLPLVGGKAANLGELLHAGFRVPRGFCVTTAAFARFLAGATDDPLVVLDRVDAADVDGLREAGRTVRSRLAELPLPDAVADAVVAAWQRLGPDDAYAVRSSATAEDLPAASFAGQQDTYLNVRGRTALLDRVRDCFCSLFTDRAIDYRMQRGIDHRSVRLAVVVQRMIEPTVSGVLFTADPVSGNRVVAAIDASYGLGEVTVSGIATADAIRVDIRDHRILASAVADKRVEIRALADGGTEQVQVSPQRRRLPALRDDQALALARLGTRIEAHFGSPQDVEWAVVDGTFVVLQARPITTLFPVPEPRPDDDSLHVYLSFGHLQVMTDPMPPMATSLWRIVLPVGRTGEHGTSRYTAEAGSHLYFDMSPVLRHRLAGRRFPRMLRIGDRLAADALAEVARRPDFRSAGPRLRLRRLLVALAPYVGRALRVAVTATPEGTTEAMLELVDRKVAGVEAALAAAHDLRAKLDVCDAEVRRLFVVPARWLPYFAAGLLANVLLRPVLRGVADPEDLAAVGRGLRGNVATEMNLAVGDLADLARSDALRAVLDRSDQSVVWRLAAIARLDGGDAFLAAWHAFLDRYGARGNSEIDVSRPRWAEDPAALVQMVRSAARQGAPGSHRARFRVLHDEGVAAGHRLVAAARDGPAGWLREPVVRRQVRLLRSLLPLREHHKFLFVRLLALVRGVVIEAGRRLHTSGRLADSDDIWLLTWPELRSALDRDDLDLDALVRRRRAAFERDRDLTAPRVITSDGEIITPAPADVGGPDGALVGSGVSAGVAEGRAKVVLDPTLANLQPGDILVAPFTDPGWTPLFVSAVALVTEVGGLMTHGSVVAREYGIPAVVGVVDATRRIRDGQRLRVHGDAGYVELLDAEPTTAHTS